MTAKERIISICNVIYHNLRLIRHSVNELNYVLNHPYDSILMPFIGFPPSYLDDLIDIHGRNATILLHSLIKGELSIDRLINLCEANIDGIEFYLPKDDMRTLLKMSRSLLAEQKEKHWELLSATRDKIAGHQDEINAGPIRNIADITFPLSDMLELLPKLEQAFAIIYYPLTGTKYVQLEDKSFLDKAIHALYDKAEMDLKEN